MEILACAILLAGALPADPVAPSAPLQDARTGTPEEERSYAARESETPDLAEFRGGDSGVLLTIAIIAAVVLILWILIPW